MKNKLLLLLISCSVGSVYSQFKFDTSPTRFKGHRTSVGDVEFSPDGKKLATCGGKNQIIIFDVFTGEIISATQEGSAPINYLTYNYDGTILASAGFTKGTQILNSKTLTKIASIDGYGEFSDIEFSPIDNTIAVLGSYEKDPKKFAVTLHNVIDGKKIKEFYNVDANFSYASCVDFSPNGKFIAVGFSNKEKGVRIWNVETGILVKYIKHEYDVTDLEFSPDGKFVGGGGIDNNVNIWEVSSGKLIHKLIGLNDYVGTVDYSPDGKYIVGGGSDSKSKFKMWETTTGKLVQSEEEGGPNISALKFSPDGQSLAMGLITYGDAFDVATVYVYRTPEGVKTMPWYKFTSSQSKTSLEFPNEPTSSSQNKGSYTYHNAKLDNGSSIFTFYGVQYNFAINDQKRNSAIQTRIDFYAKDLTNVQKSTFTYNGYTGYDMAGYKGKVRYRYRFIFIDDMHYQYSLSSFGKSETSVEKRFMESFSIPRNTSSSSINQTSTNNNSHLKTSFKVGDRIQGNWKGQGKYYHGKIGKISGNNIYILYDDGDVEWTTLKYIKAE